MKIDINRTALSEALGLVNAVIPSRTPKPILRCVLLSGKDKDVRVCATDLEVGINSLIRGVEVHEPGVIVVQADKLSAIVRESNEDALSIKAQNGMCEITGTDSHFTVYGQDDKHYPPVPTFDGVANLEIGLGELQSGIEKSLFAAAKESSRYAINGVLWEISGKKLLLVATDGRRLARCRVNLKKAADEATSQQRIIVPAKTMALLEKISSSDKETVAVKFLDNQILISCANVVISTNLVEGHFPKYEDIIPTDYENKLSLNTEAVQSAVRRAALLTSEESRGIKLSLCRDNIVFSGRAPETGDAQINMPVDYKGEPLEIGFNPQFLLDALRVIKTPEFDIEFGSGDRPGLIKSGTEFLYVLMPINLG